ncbi:hypothetical protein SAMN05421819_3675 [Bryocella elongata]|uniref:Uncharacterized protein n=1 Tax=Bryocella elongata TaxID=863522 RepID=A0A1H6BFZ7_9BACT|nr:hypothetical protein [Bryocella elongata]SEG59600.1 hypothetical protein SAMN05421819_3675 [Bryocella elongata]
MRTRVSLGLMVASVVFSLSAVAQIPQPPGAMEALEGITSEHASHTAFTFDRDMIQSAAQAFDNGRGLTQPIAGLNSITFQTYRFHEPAFYIPENVHALMHAYNMAGWTHLVDQNAPAKDSASPSKPLTDLWLHFSGVNVDGVTVLIRAPKQMTVVEVSGILKPLDLLHLSGHFGIPKIDSGALMVPAPPER